MKWKLGSIHFVLVALRIRPPAFDSRRAIEVAREKCEALGLPWDPPIHVSTRVFSYVIETQADSFGCNILISIDRATGTIFDVFRVPS